MGVAAVNIDGNTIWTFFDLKTIPKDASTTIKPLDEQDLHDLRVRLGVDPDEGKTKAIVIIDEVSMVTPTVLAMIDARLRQATGVELPFGGVLLLCFGDFDQLPPVHGVYLTNAAVAVSQRDITIERLDKNRKLPVDKRLPTIRAGSNKKKRQTKKENGRQLA